MSKYLIRFIFIIIRQTLVVPVLNKNSIIDLKQDRFGIMCFEEFSHGFFLILCMGQGN